MTGGRSVGGIFGQLPGGVLSELIVSIALFLAGFVVRGLVGRFHRSRDTARARAHALRSQPAYSANWLRHYYLDLGRLDDLYLVELDGSHCYLPMLTKPAWTNGPYPEADLLDLNGAARRSTTDENKRVLADRARFIALDSSGGRLWNEDLFCVAGIGDTATGPQLTVTTSTYYQYLSACGGLEDETIDAVRSQRARTPIRDRRMQSVDQAGRCLLGAHGLGMQVTFVFPMDAEIQVLVQRRALTVAIYAGSLAVVPVFACQPASGSARVGGPPALFHNFLREYLEELYDMKEVERMTSHIDPRWFYDEPAARALRDLHERGDFIFELLGVGIDALNGEVNVAALAAVLDPDFATRELSRMKSNWELESLEVMPLYSSELAEHILKDEFQPGSAFSLALALDRVSCTYRSTMER